MAQQQLKYRQRMTQIRQERQEPQFNIQDHEFMQIPGSHNENPQVRRNFANSYASVSRDENFMTRMEKLMEQQVQTTNMLMNMMNQLMSVLCRK